MRPAGVLDQPRLRRQHRRHVGRAGTSAGGTSASFGLDLRDDKVVLAARDDAASFVASDGAIRGAQLEAALRHLREHAPQARDASDLELAQAILAQ